MTEFQEKFRMLLAGKRMSSGDLAKAGVVSQACPSTTYRWTRGKGFPNIQQVAELARYFGVPAAYLADDNIDLPTADSEAPRLSDGERRVLEKCRQLTAEEADVVLEVAIRLGRRETWRRLFAVDHATDLRVARDREGAK